MGFLKEFKEFAVKGNVVDMAVGVVIGAAFTKIVGSLIDDVITPLILNPVLQQAGLTKIEELATSGGVKYGMFISAVLNFIIVAFVLFMMIKAINKLKKPEAPAEEAPAVPSDEVLLLREIRDELKNKK